MPNYRNGLPTYKGSSGATLTTQTDYLTSGITTTSTSFVTTPLSITIANRSGGYAICTGICPTYNNDAANRAKICLFDDAAALEGASDQRTISTTHYHNQVVHNIVSLDGSVIAVYYGCNATTAGIIYSDIENEPSLQILEIS